MSSISPMDPNPPVGDEADCPEDFVSSLVDWTVPPLIQAGQEAYLRDLPGLLKEHKGRWVAYSGDRRLGIARTRNEAYDLGYKQGLTRDDFLVLGVDPSDLDDIRWEDFRDI